MNTKRTSASNCAETVPTRYELIDKDGRRHGPFYNLTQVRSYAEFYWPDQEQDEDRTGKGWDVQFCGCDDSR